MKITLSKLVYNLLINIPICFALCFTAVLISGKGINWPNFWINISVSYVLAMLIGLFVPLMLIGKRFTALFKVDTTTYTHNIRYRLLATFIGSVIFFSIISPSLTILNYFILKNQTIEECLLSWLANIPLMFLVAFLSTLVSDLPAYKIAHKIDDKF
jgi:hypothetical protein